jgi:endonuclease VIII
MEGPSLVILKEELQPFIHKRIVSVSGNSKIDQSVLKHQMLRDVQTWGKHLLLCFDTFFLKIHFLLFGSYRINQKKDRPERLSLAFRKGELNLYSCSVKVIESDPKLFYDFDRDVMSPTWKAAKALTTLKEMKSEMVCDALLNQNIFAGVGNIIKNEVLYRIGIHPETSIEALPTSMLKELVYEAKNYSFDFYKWKKAYELRNHWLVYRRKNCVKCGHQICVKPTGKLKRRTFFCPNCQALLRKRNQPS